MPSHETQKARILRMLENAGGEWVTGVALNTSGIYAYSQRVGELVREGHPIESTGKGHGVALYRLAQKEGIA